MVEGLKGCFSTTWPLNNSALHRFNSSTLHRFNPSTFQRFDPSTIESNRLPFVGVRSNFLGMSAPEFDVEYIAHLARISLTSAEEQKLAAQLHDILGYIEKLRHLDVSGVEPTAHAVPMVNVTRADEVRPSISNEEALRNAPAKAGGLYIVPKIVE